MPNGWFGRRFRAKQKDWIVLGRLRLSPAVINSDDLSSFPSRFRVPSRKTSAKQVAAVFFCSGRWGRSKSKESEKETKKCDVLHGLVGWSADAQTYEISQIKKLTFQGMFNAMSINLLWPLWVSLFLGDFLSIFSQWLSPQWTEWDSNDFKAKKKEVVSMQVYKS